MGFAARSVYSTEMMFKINFACLLVHKSVPGIFKNVEIQTPARRFTVGTELLSEIEMSSRRLSATVLFPARRPFASMCVDIL